MVKIVADTTCGLPLDLAARRGITMIPQIVIFGEMEYRDDTGITSQQFLDKLRTANVLPKTAAPPPALYNPVYAGAVEKGEPVVVIAPSARVSGTVRAAEVAARDFPGADIRVVDTLTIAGNLATMVLQAQEMAERGAGADEIVAMLQDLIKRQRLYFLVDTLEYLQKGGRIGGAKALIGELLKVKPILTVGDGQVQPFEQQRTKKRAVARLTEIVLEQCRPGPGSHLCVMHADALEDARQLAASLGSSLNVEDVPIYLLPPAIIVHGGPGVLAVGFMA